MTAVGRFRQVGELAVSTQSGHSPLSETAVQRPRLTALLRGIGETIRRAAMACLNPPRIAHNANIVQCRRSRITYPVLLRAHRVIE